METGSELYFFSGLGADRRLFTFLDLDGFRINYIDWIPPEVNEPIERYAGRIAQQITGVKPILVGLSFGGIVAVEIAKLISVEKLILISSVKEGKQLPLLYRIAGKAHLHKLIPAFLFKRPQAFTYWMFGAHTSLSKKLLTEMLKDTDGFFLKWAIGCVLIWKNKEVIPNSYSIHGIADRLLPARDPDYPLPGGHLVVVDRAKEVSAIIRKILG